MKYEIKRTIQYPNLFYAEKDVPYKAKSEPLKSSIKYKLMKFLRVLFL